MTIYKYEFINSVCIYYVYCRIYKSLAHNSICINYLILTQMVLHRYWLHNYYILLFYIVQQLEQEVSNLPLQMEKL